MRIISIVAKIIAGILIILFLIISFIRTPWGQNIIKNQVVSYISSKTQSTISLDKLYITFSGNITIEGLYIEGLQKDTLLYSRSLTADIPIWPLLTGKGIRVDKLDWMGVRANIYRENEKQGFNYQFLLDAFMSPDKAEVAVTDTTNVPLKLSVGKINLSEIVADYNDQAGGMVVHLDLGTFTINMDQTNMGEMKFEVESAKLRDSRITYVQTKPFPESDDASENSLPYLVLKNIQINNFVGHYQSDPEGIKADLDINDLRLYAPVVDLADNNIDISNFLLHESAVSVQINQSNTVDSTRFQSSNIPDSGMAFTWPEWHVTLDEITLTENDISYRVDDSQPVIGQFNLDALVLNQFTLMGADIYLRDQSAGAHLRELHFKEGSGLAVDKFQFLWKMDNQNFNLSDLKIEALNSHISGNLSAQFASVESLINEPDKARVDLELSHIALDLNEFYRFQPELRHNPYLETIGTKTLTGNLKASGRLSSLRIPDAGVRWGNQTALFATGRLYHPTDPKRLGFDFSKILIKSSRADMNRFMEEDSLGIRYPEEIRITAQLAGNLEDVTADALLESTLGSLSVKGNYKSKDSLVFLADMEIKNLQLDTLLQMPELGNLYLTVQTTGQGVDFNSLDASLQATVDSFSYNGYPIVGWQMDGDIADGSGRVKSSYQDSNLNVRLDAFVVLDSIAPEVDATVNLKGADLAALGFMDKKVKMALLLNAGFKGNGNTFNASAIIQEGTVVYEDNSYPLGRMNLTTCVTPDTTSVTFDSRMLDLTLQSNTSPAGFSNAIIRHVESYLTDTLSFRDSMILPVHVLVEASLRDDPLLSEVFLPGLQEMATMKLKVDFDEENKNLMAAMEVPNLKYSGIEIDSVGMSAYSDRDHFHMELGLREIIAGPLTINRTFLVNEVRNQTLYSHFQAKYQGKELVHLRTEISKKGDSLQIHFDPTDLVFDAKDWEIPASNQILIGEKKIEFRNFRIQSGDQKLTINDNPGDTDLNIEFRQFNIANIISYFNPDSLLATGDLNGVITLEEPLGNAALLADLNINAFHVFDVDMGTLTLNGETEDAKNYSFNLNLRGGEVALSTKAEYHVTENASDISLDISIDRINMKAVESFSMGEIKNSSGYLSGYVKASGSLSDLSYDGELVFNDASLTPSILQTPFILGSQQIVFDNDGIRLQNFSISDKDGNSFTVDGEIFTTDILNPSFDLKMTATNFQVLNASEEKNSLFYGKASFDAKATLTGDLNLPVLNLQLDVGAGTDVTYIMPQGRVDLNKREGIVEFVNKTDPNNILSEEEEESVVIQGYDINAVVSVGSGASFTVIISKQTGDNFKISGDGDLNFSIDANGRMSLSGIYTLQDGHYEMNLYNLVSRRFDIASGSTVSWSGDPFDAKLDVRAIYRIETSSMSLMASQTSGADPSVKNQYRRKLPFLVYLNVDGQLSQPKLSFSLDMPEDSRGELGGQVYSRIQQVNQEDQMLNKQVFSLLVLGRFYPDSGSDGSSGGIVNVARENLNQALADQLNLFSDKLLGDTGLELNFGLDSYTDYQGKTPQSRTELDIAAQKKFLDDRLIVKVGSEIDIEGGNTNPGEENPLIGNVSVEYLLTENGQFRIRAFRKNVYENVIDGQTIVSGLALLFTREFNKFNELWKPMLERRRLNATEESKDK